MLLNGVKLLYQVHGIQKRKCGCRKKYTKYRRDANEIKDYTGRKREGMKIKLPLQNNCAFEPQEKFFCLHSGGVTGERSIMSNNTVARDNDGERIASVGSADRSKAARHANSASELLVCNGCSVRNPQELLPYPQLKGCAYLINRGGKFCELAVKITVQLVDGFLVAAFVFDDIIVVEMDGKPVEKVFLRFFWNTNLAHPAIGRSDIDVTNFRVE